MVFTYCKDIFFSRKKQIKCPKTIIKSVNVRYNIKTNPIKFKP